MAGGWGGGVGAHSSAPLRYDLDDPNIAPAFDHPDIS